MATLVFGALGTAVGGPLGGAIGSLLGRELDRQIIGMPTREGPRLKELAVSTSSYGTPIARLMGATRASGTIIWATDMKERRETRAAGKGQPGVTQYSYSVSLAVALSSRPIKRVGRIWADGNLLRGAAGDLKTGGQLRVHLGHHDQAPDPLMAAALGARCPAHRGLAYAVFEDLQLGDFGNRIPALSFEVFADGAGAGLPAALIEPLGRGAGAPVPAAAPIAGFEHDGGSVASALEAIGALVPIHAGGDGDGALRLGAEPAGPAHALPEPIAWADGEFGQQSGRQLTSGWGAAPGLLRYYDDGRDYQPGVQCAASCAPAGGELLTLELPATLAAAGAAGLIAAAAARARAAGERLQVRIASLDPAFAPGALVAVPGGGQWRIISWEWRSSGVELALRRAPIGVSAQAPADAGTAWQPADRLPAATRLVAFELPWDGAGSAEAARIHVAAGAAAPGRWSGAALYAERAGTLVPLPTAGATRAVIGTLAAPLAGSPALMFEPGGVVDVLCDDGEAADFLTVDGAALALGANRLLVGEEIVQFMRAEPMAGSRARWRLSGLLRGRGASEAEAREGHPAGTRVVLLDERLVLLDGAAIDPAAERIAAIGAGDSEPVFAVVAAPGRSRRPPAPVHPVSARMPDGRLTLGWTRRARGAWAWEGGVEVPLVEESERYEVGAGPVVAPLMLWDTAAPSLTLSADTLAALPSGTTLWVRQIGRHARSPARHLITLA